MTRAHIVETMAEDLNDRVQGFLALRCRYNASGQKGEDIQLISAALAAAPSGIGQAQDDDEAEEATR